MFEWAAFLDLAHDLVEEANNEAALRSAISRAYYAVLHVAHQRLIDAGWTLPDGSMHQHVWRAYADATDPRRRNNARLGNALRIWRNAADYKSIFPNPLRDTATEVLKSADDLFALLEQIDRETS